jgi:hypothetical protein
MVTELNNNDMNDIYNAMITNNFRSYHFLNYNSIRCLIYECKEEKDNNYLHNMHTLKSYCNAIFLRQYYFCQVRIRLTPNLAKHFGIH